MDNVILLKRHEITMLLKRKEEGTWVKGKYIEKEASSKNVRGTLLPVSRDTLKNYPQGTISIKDREFFTKENLSEGNILTKDGKEWKVIKDANFNIVADIKVYILKRSTKDD